MKTISSSSTFSPKPEQCNFFSFTVTLPDSLNFIPLFANPILCSKCNSYKDSREICPICDCRQYNPEESLASFRIRSTSTGNFGRINLIIFDLDMSLNDLLKISDYLLSESDNENFEQLRNNAYLFVFIGSNISFLNCLENEIKFEFVPVTYDFRCFAKPLIYFQQFLKPAIKIAKQFSQPPLPTGNLFDNLIAYLHSENVFDFIQDIVYIYSKTIPRSVSRFEYLPRFHFIHFGSSLSKNDLSFVSSFKASFFTSDVIDQSFLIHLQKWLSKSKVIFSPYFTITSSTGIVFSHLSGPIHSVKIENNRVTTEVFSCSSEMPPVASATAVDKHLYNNNHCFSFQICFHYHSDMIYVFTEKYHKAQTELEWVNSFNRSFLLFILLQKYSGDLLKSYIDLKPHYQMMPCDFKLDRHCKKILFYFNSYKKLFGNLFHSSNSSISLDHAIFILFFFTYQSLTESMTFIDSLANEKPKTNSFVFRPFRFINEKYDKDDHEVPYLISKMNDQQFSQLRNLILSFQTNLCNYKESDTLFSLFS